MKKKNFVFFVLGVVITLIALKGIMPPIIRGVLKKRLVKQYVVEDALPTPFHAFTLANMKRIILEFMPDKVEYLTDEVIIPVYTGIRKKYQPAINAAIKGINSDLDMATYMDKIGVLKEIGIDKETALKEIAMINYEYRYLKPKLGYARYYPTAVPEKPVRYPAEFETIGAVIFAWPIYNPGTNWHANAELIEETSEVAKAWVLVPGRYEQKGVELYLTKKGIDLSNINFLHVKYDRVWMRDCGPTAVFSGKDKKAVFIWNPYFFAALPYNKFDNEVAPQLAAYFNIPIYRLPVIMEGGNIITDGKGTIIVLASILERNGDVDEEKLKLILREYFGAKRPIVLSSVPGEHCGHVDMVIKFIDEDTLMIAQAPNDHGWYSFLESITDELKRIKSVNGKDYRIFRIPLAPTEDDIQERSFVNSLTVNDKVIVPLYNTKQDKIALDVYRQAMPNYKIVGIDYRVYPLGAIHCQSKEMPNVITEGNK